MPPSKAPKRIAILATLIVSACGTSSEVVGFPIIPDMDPLPVAVSTPCGDPDVASDAVRALAENRRALAACRSKHRRAVAAYNNYRKAMAELSVAAESEGKKPFEL